MSENDPRLEMALDDARRRHEREMEDAAALAGLTEFERGLAHKAAAEARCHVVAEIRSLVGPAAVTVDAETLRIALRNIAIGVDFFRSPGESPVLLMGEMRRAARIAGDCRRAEANGESFVQRRPGSTP